MSINGYELTSDWKVIGGMSEVAFAEKDGKEWFIKKYITPKYPLPDSPGSERMKEKQRKKCELFERHHREINGRVSSCCGIGGGLIYAVNFFREGNCYYKINEKINAEEMSVSDISKLDFRNLLIIMRSLVNSLRILHHAEIVHGDLKPDNILIKLTTTGTYTTKLIDFDDSYISANPPEDRSSVVGTPEYYSPEMYRYIADKEKKISGNTLTTKTDIFALGVIFCEYLTGKKPIIPEEYSGTYSAVQAGESLVFASSDNFSVEMRELVCSMLSLDPDKRPNIDEVFRILPMPRPKRSTKPKILKFATDELSVIKGNSVTISWAVENASSVSINDNPVSLSGSSSFPAQEIFTIIAKDSSDNSATKEIRISILEPEPEPPSDLKGIFLKRHR